MRLSKQHISLERRNTPRRGGVLYASLTEQSSDRLNVSVFFVPVFVPAGKTSVLIVRGFTAALASFLFSAVYDAWMSYGFMSTTRMSFVLNCLLSDAPCSAAPKTAASSAFTFRAILLLGGS